jgi:D-alanyl-D-alanine carboxypeptidase/D-alanyl-D-alanine-endopeptidase (penicillin-binding protein 4)
VQTIPPIPDLQFTNEIIAAAGKSDDSYISGIPFSNHRRLYGSIPSHSNNFPVKGDIPDPGMCLASYLKFHLEKNKIRVTGQASTYRLNPAKPGKKHVISVKVSPDLASIVRVVNVRSNNHYAEHIYKLLTIKNGIDIPTFWEQKGLDSSALFLFDGSGISPGNAVSASFMNSILEFMYKKEGFSGAFYQSLPWAGKEGTVTSFLKGSALEGKVRVKSGSMTNVQAYSGYITYDGTDYAFTIILNHFTGKRPLLRKQIETLLIGFLGNAQADVGDSR